MQPTLTPAELERFWSKVKKTSTCWLWTGGTRKGYGAFQASNGGRRVTVQAHRIAYSEIAGDIPAGLVLDHVCRVRACVNPDHLRPVSDRVNILAGIAPAAINARKTHCKRGHSLVDESNVYRRGRMRVCKACRRASDKARRTELVTCSTCGSEFAPQNLKRHERTHRAARVADTTDTEGDE